MLSDFRLLADLRQSRKICGFLDCKLINEALYEGKSFDAIFYAALTSG